MKQLLYVGYYIGQDIFEAMIANGNKELSQARQNFEKRLLHEFAQTIALDKWNCVSYIPESDYPLLGKNCINGKEFKVFSINRSSITSQIKAFKDFFQYINEGNFRNNAVLMYAVHPILSIPIFLLKKRLNLTVTTICSEVPQFRASGNNVSFLTRLKLLLQTWENRKFDKYILFAEAMKDVIPTGKKPYIVLEGIAPEVVCNPVSMKKNVVMYAGGLGKQNNIDLLIDACEFSDIVDELWICGTGEDVDRIKARAIGKIRYLGNMPSDKVVEYERKAKLLVNLRNPEIEITKYAFPSKIMEYMSVGTAVLTTKLEGIPKEYYSYIYSVEDLSVSGVKNAIEKVLTIDEEEYIERCVEAQKFISTTKNVHVQAERILEFCMN